MISPLQRPLPVNTQHSQHTNIQALGGIRTHDRSRRADADLRLRPRGQWDRLLRSYYNLIFRFRTRDEAVYVSLLPWLRMGGVVPPPIYFYGVHGENFIFIPLLGAGGKVSHLLWTVSNSKTRWIVMCV